MRWFVIFAIALVLLFGCTSYGSQGAQGNQGVPTGGTNNGGGTGGPFEIKIQGFAFAPESLSVKAGSSVTWTNLDSAPHTVTGDGWDSGEIPQYGTFTKIFDTPGTYAYHCSIHSSMKGQVVVS